MTPDGVTVVTLVASGTVAGVMLHLIDKGHRWAAGAVLVGWWTVCAAAVAGAVT